MATYTGEVIKAYSPSRKTGYSKFFFMLREADGQERKGMAPAVREMLDGICLGNVVEVTGSARGGWMNPTQVRVIHAKEIPGEIAEIEIGHVGHAKPTRHGEGFYAKVGDEWIVVPVKVASAFFGRELTEFPRRGRGTMRAKVKRNGSTVVTEILDWKPLERLVELDVPFRDLFWTSQFVIVWVEGRRVRIPADKLPFEIDAGSSTPTSGWTRRCTSRRRCARSLAAWTGWNGKPWMRRSPQRAIWRSRCASCCGTPRSKPPWPRSSRSWLLS